VHPSGHVEPGETFEQAVRREAREETGATLGPVACIGYFVLTDSETGRVRYAPTYVGEVQHLGSAAARSRPTRAA
jgi:8-oxo-dGTP pyrophosphatase MutT (NUDIX family)